MGLKRKTKKKFNKCVYCGCKFKNNNEKNINWLVPISQGGKKVHSNLVVCCQKCSIDKNKQGIIYFLSNYSTKKNFLKFLIINKDKYKIMLNKFVNIIWQGMVING
jgi:5-methylcytosine-specific restriction endonuclease McrA